MFLFVKYNKNTKPHQCLFIKLLFTKTLNGEWTLDCKQYLLQKKMFYHTLKFSFSILIFSLTAKRFSITLGKG